MPTDREPTTQAFGAALIDGFAAVLGTRAGVTAAVTLSAEAVRPMWTMTVRVGSPTAGAVTLGMSREVCATLVRLVCGEERQADDGAIVEVLQDIVGQAVDGIHGRPAGDGRVYVEAPCAVTAAPEGVASAHVVRLDSAELTVGLWIQEERSAATADLADRATRTSAAASMRAVEEELSALPAVPANLDVILDIDLPLSVRFGQTDLTLEALTRLGPGSLVDLARSPEDPVDVLVNGRLVARGEVVVVGGNYGVRILEVVSTADRVRSLQS